MYRSMTKDLKLQIKPRIDSAYDISVELDNGEQLTKGNDGFIYENVARPTKEEGSRDIKFKVTISLKEGECPENMNLQFSTPGYGGSDHVQVQVQALCNCLCESDETEATQSPDGVCTNGDENCGKCECDAGWSGKNCSCDLSKDQQEEKCKGDSDVEVCSGKGKCVCGKCECNEGDDAGEFCQCGGTCPKVEEKVCNGHGECNCGNCECTGGWQGDSCECDSNQCKSDNGFQCGGHDNGECTCSDCQCKSYDYFKFVGETCDHIEPDCDKILECVAENNCTPDETKLQQEFKATCDKITPNFCQETYTIVFDINNSDGIVPKFVGDPTINCEKQANIIWATIITTATALLIGLVIVSFALIVQYYLDTRESSGFMRDIEEINNE